MFKLEGFFFYDMHFDKQLIEGYLKIGFNPKTSIEVYIVTTKEFETFIKTWKKELENEKALTTNRGQILIRSVENSVIGPYFGLHTFEDFVRIYPLARTTLLSRETDHKETYRNYFTSKKGKQRRGLIISTKPFYTEEIISGFFGEEE